jgi:hypothetical protein
MKTLFLFTLTLILTLNLNARENPFAATNAYEEEAARIIESNEQDMDTLNDQEYIQEMQEKMSMMNSENKNKVEKAVQTLMPALKTQKPMKTPVKKPKTYSKNEVNKLIKKAKKETTQLIEEKIQKAAIEPKQIVYVKPRTDLAVEDPIKTEKILPFLTLNYDNKMLTLNSKYLVVKKFTIDKEKKLIIDYKAKVNFYTKRKELKSKNFNKITVGNHKKEKFFRVVLQLEEKPSKYTVSYKEKLITIKINKL